MIRFLVLECREVEPAGIVDEQVHRPMHLLRLGHRSSEALDIGDVVLPADGVGEIQFPEAVHAAGGQEQGMARPRSEPGRLQRLCRRLLPVITANGLVMGLSRCVSSTAGPASFSRQRVGGWISLAVAYPRDPLCENTLTHVSIARPGSPGHCDKDVAGPCNNQDEAPRVKWGNSGPLN